MQPSEPPTRRIDRRDLALGIVAIVLGIAVAAVARTFPGGSAYDALGPRLLPYLVAGGLVLTGLPILIQGLRGGRDTEAGEQIDLGPVAMIAGALLVPFLLLQTIGWIPVAGIVFAIGAHAFGSRRTAFNLLIGLCFGGVTFILFNQVLGLNLPAGNLVTLVLGR